MTKRFLYLLQFIEKFQEVKEATRLVGGTTKPTSNGQSTGVTPVTSANASPVSNRAASATQGQQNQSDSQQLLEPPGAHLNNSGSATIKVEGEGGTSHVRSQSLSAGESPKHQIGDKSSAPLGSGEAQLKYENDRLKLALAQRFVLHLWFYNQLKVRSSALYISYYFMWF